MYFLDMASHSGLGRRRKFLDLQRAFSTFTASAFADITPSIWKKTVNCCDCRLRKVHKLCYNHFILVQVTKQPLLFTLTSGMLLRTVHPSLGQVKCQSLRRILYDLKY